MTERVDIANLALDWLGEEPITSLEDDSQRALSMKINYIPARDATMEAHDWTFAIMRFIPAINAVAPVYGATYAFDVPSEILRVISVDRNDANSVQFRPRINQQEQIDWQFERGQVICDEKVIYCRGVQRVTEEGRFSPTFVHALAAKLAFLTAIVISGSEAKQANMKALYDQFILEAKSRDGLQGRSRRLRNRSLQKVR